MAVSFCPAYDLCCSHLHQNHISLCRDDANNKHMFTMYTVCIVHNWWTMTGQHTMGCRYQAVNILPNPLRAKVIITSKDVVIIFIPLESQWKLIDFKTQGSQTLLSKVIFHSIVVKGVITIDKNNTKLTNYLHSVTQRSHPVPRFFLKGYKLHGYQVFDIQL